MSSPSSALVRVHHRGAAPSHNRGAAQSSGSPVKIYVKTPSYIVQMMVDADTVRRIQKVLGDFIHLNEKLAANPSPLFANDFFPNIISTADYFQTDLGIRAIPPSADIQVQNGSDSALLAYNIGVRALQVVDDISAQLKHHRSLDVLGWHAAREKLHALGIQAKIPQNQIYREKEEQARLEQERQRLEQERLKEEQRKLRIPMLVAEYGLLAPKFEEQEQILYGLLKEELTSKQLPPFIMKVNAAYAAFKEEENRLQAEAKQLDYQIDKNVLEKVQQADEKMRQAYTLIHRYDADLKSVEGIDCEFQQFRAAVDAYIALDHAHRPNSQAIANRMDVIISRKNTWKTVFARVSLASGGMPQDLVDLKRKLAARIDHAVNYVDYFWYELSMMKILVAYQNATEQKNLCVVPHAQDLGQILTIVKNTWLPDFDKLIKDHLAKKQGRSLDQAEIACFDKLEKLSQEVRANLVRLIEKTEKIISDQNAQPAGAKPTVNPTA